MASNIPASIELCRGLFRLIRRLHQVPAPARSEALLAELCRLFRGTGGSIVVAQVDAASATVVELGNFTFEVAARATSPGKPSAPASEERRVADRPRTSPRDARRVAKTTRDSTGSCHEAYAEVPHLRRFARLSICRRKGARRFSNEERELLNAIYAECAWIYDDASSPSIDAK